MRKDQTQRMLPQFTRYAAQYNCSLVEAIADRDYPLTSAEIVDILEELAIEPSAVNIHACRPDTQERVSEYIRDLDY